MRVFLHSETTGTTLKVVRRADADIEALEAKLAVAEALAAERTEQRNVALSRLSAAEAELERQKQLTVWAQDEQDKWKALADERWELAACHLDGCRRRDEELEALSDRLDERDAQLAALEDEVERADAEIKRLNDICDRLAAAGRSHD